MPAYRCTVVLVEDVIFLAIIIANIICNDDRVVVVDDTSGIVATVNRIFKQLMLRRRLHNDDRAGVWLFLIVTSLGDSSEYTVLPGR